MGRFSFLVNLHPTSKPATAGQSGPESDLAGSDRRRIGLAGHDEDIGCRRPWRYERKNDFQYAVHGELPKSLRIVPSFGWLMHRAIYTPALNLSTCCTAPESDLILKRFCRKCRWHLALCYRKGNAAYEHAASRFYIAAPASGGD